MGPQRLAPTIGLLIQRPPVRVRISGGPRVDVIVEPSSFPPWMDEPRTRDAADRMVRVMEAAFAGATIKGKDRKLWRRLREIAADPEWVYEMTIQGKEATGA